jgi:hypothetical protein
MGGCLSIFSNIANDAAIKLPDDTGNVAAVQFGADAENTYIRYDATGNALQIYVGEEKAATFESDGGILHGSWNVESSLVTSDRRLKTNIMPLQRTLRDVILPRGEKKVPARPDKGATGDGALWLLRQLRPVSYSFRKGMDSKFMRFGFIADELDTVVPEVVRTSGDREVSDQKAVVYQDLIALLAAASQSQQKLIESLEANSKRLEDNSKRLEDKSKRLEDNSKRLESRLLQLEKAKEEETRTKAMRRLRKRKAKASINVTNVTNETNATNLSI